MTGFDLKILAVIAMIFDHIKYGVPYTNCFATQYFGRLAFPIFAFLITEGAVHTKSRKKYLLRMLIFACISQIPYMMFRSLISTKFLLNIMFTFVFGIISIYIIDYFKEHEEIPAVIRYFILFISITAILVLGTYIPVDYGWFGIATVIFFYIFKENKIARTASFILLVLAYYYSFCSQSIQNIDILKVIFTSLPSFIVLLYNGKEGRKMKYFFYLFYPLHMLLIYFVSMYFK